MLILSSLSKIQVDQFNQFFFSCLFPGNHGVIVRVVVPHQFDGMTHRDIVLLHEVSDLQVGSHLSSSFSSFPPGGVISQGSPLSSFPRVSSVFGRVTSLLVADEALSVPDVLSSFTRRKVNLVYIHSIGIRTRGLASRRDVAVSSSSEFPESYYISVEFPSLIKPLFPPPTSLSIGEDGGSHHDSKLLGYSPLEGVYQDAIIIDSAVCLGQFKGSGVLIKVSIELIHAEGIDGLAGSVFKILQDKGFFESPA